MCRLNDNMPHLVPLPDLRLVDPVVDIHQAIMTLTLIQVAAQIVVVMAEAVVVVGAVVTNTKYSEGTILECNGITGEVISNTKLPGDICVKWNNGLMSSYDPEWLDEFTEVTTK